MFCTKCGEELQAGQAFCTSCGSPAPAGATDFDLQDKIREAVGVEKLKGFSFRSLMADAFRRHPIEELEDSFTIGTARNTPQLQDVKAEWPRPWMFVKTLVGTLFLYGLFSYGLVKFEEANLIPGLIMLGTFAVPLSTLVFFFEMNILKNVSVYQLMRMTIFGGVVALVLTLLLYTLIPEKNMGALVIGVVEEVGKLLALMVVSRSLKYKYKLNGLLLGAAVGTGFAIFESMGYALNGLASGENGIANMHIVVILRGLLSPFGHVVWTAICGAAMWRVKGDASFRFAMVKDPRFFKLFLLAVGAHALWDMDFELIVPLLKHVALGVVCWIVVLSLIQEGINEVKTIQKAITEGD